LGYDEGYFPSCFETANAGKNPHNQSYTDSNTSDQPEEVTDTTDLGYSASDTSSNFYTPIGPDESLDYPNFLDEVHEDLANYHEESPDSSSPYDQNNSFDTNKGSETAKDAPKSPEGSSDGDSPS
jgi:hypothetical protein